MKPRSDSLYAKIAQLHKPDEVEMERLDELMLFLKSGGSYEDAAGLCHEWGIQTSATAVHDLYERHAFPWLLDRARAGAAAAGKLPSFEKQISAMSEQRVFEMLSRADVKDGTLVTIRALELEKQRLEFDKRKAEGNYEMKAKDLALKERRIVMLESRMQKASAKLQELRDPKKADDATTRQAILDHVDRLMGIKPAQEPPK
jgi:hypothetical protein